MSLYNNRTQCLGFGPTEGSCPNPPGCPHSPFWCKDCNALRMAHIKRGFESILDRFKDKTAPPDRAHRQVCE